MERRTAALRMVGGDFNDVGIAREAAGRASMMLCERNYLAGATSSTSTNLIHGGSRCLESYEFRLVRGGLFERERLQIVAAAQ
jgi:glycerol-3-phosphate dehydrogenase